MSETQDQTQQDEVKVRVAAIAKRDLVNSKANAPEDAFKGLYGESAGTGQSDALIMTPPHNPSRLKQACLQNNTLLQCIAAYICNLEGPDYEIEPKDKKEEDFEDDKTISEIKEFFDEPYPGESFTDIREQTRFDIEATGNGYLEILRNTQREIVFMRRLDSCYMRLIRLGDLMPIKKTVLRRGKEQEVVMLDRERVFVQKVGTKLVYFREFGSTRDVNVNNGKIQDEGVVLPADQRATEVIHFKAVEDAETPYGVPRWINNVPSVIGSRQAEELNLEFFDAGGIPPAIIFLSGGAVDEETRKYLEDILSAKPNKKNRGAVVEISSTSGSLDSAGNVKVDVAKFGSESQKDSLYENYDEKSHKRVRSSFRLPAIFLGNMENGGQHTGMMAQIKITEAQVFQPLRHSFDTTLNLTVMRDMGWQDYTFRTMPKVLADHGLQLNGIQLVSDAISDEERVRAVNEATGTTVKYDPESLDRKNREMEMNARNLALMGSNNMKLNDPNNPDPRASKATDEGRTSDQMTAGQRVSGSKADYDYIAKVADDFMFAFGYKGNMQFSDEDKENILKQVKDLEGFDRDYFNRQLAKEVGMTALEDSHILCGCAAETLAA